MEIISDILGNKDLIIRIINKHAHAAEHNFYCYYYHGSEKEKPYFFRFDDDSALMAYYLKGKKSWLLFSEPLTSEDQKAALLLTFIREIFKTQPFPTKKVFMELTEKTRRNLLKVLKNSDFRSSRINYSLIWPVFDMDSWDGDKMSGKDWKDVRYYWKKFLHEHKVEFIGPNEAKNEELKALVYDWSKQRNPKEKAYIEVYLNIIDNNFKGYDVVRIMLVDGKASAITAGMKIKNEYYYSAVGIYNRIHDRIGEVANMDDLITLKNNGYKYVDFGGSWKDALDFKKKFRPTRYYTTYMFSIVPKHRNVTDIS